MQHTRPISQTAVAYAQAVLELAEEHGQAESVGEELSAIAEVLKATPIFRLYLADPGIASHEKKEELERLFRGRASQIVMNFLGVLQKHNKLGLLSDAATAYEELLADKMGIIEVDVTVAQKLSSEELASVQETVSRVLGKNAVVHQYVDESIIGGMVLRMDDQLIDASVKHQLEALRSQLFRAAPR